MNSRVLYRSFVHLLRGIRVLQITVHRWNFLFALWSQDVFYKASPIPTDLLQGKPYCCDLVINQIPMVMTAMQPEKDESHVAWNKTLGVFMQMAADHCDIRRTLSHRQQADV